MTAELSAGKTQHCDEQACGVREGQIWRLARKSCALPVAEIGVLVLGGPLRTCEVQAQPRRRLTASSNSFALNQKAREAPACYRSPVEEDGLRETMAALAAKHYQ
jgi:hypothetical protein